MTVPRGSTAGSAAATPFETGKPDAVTPPRQYAVAVNGDDAAARTGAGGAGAG